MGYGAFPCLDHIERFMGKFLITSKYFEVIFKAFQSIIISLGRYCSGDEKLFRFTGTSGLVRFVPKKPDKYGLRYYKLVFSLRFGLPYLLYLRLHDSRGTSITCAFVVKDWCAVIRRTGIPGAIYQPETVLVFDIYYSSKESRDALQKEDTGVKYIGSVMPDRIRWWYSQASKKVKDPGDWQLLFNPRTKELFSVTVDTDENVGRKLTMLNASRVVAGKCSGVYSPPYDAYKVMFDDSDKFNRALHDRTWPYQKGDRSTKGTDGSQHDFIMSCILQNVFNICKTIGGDELGAKTFCQRCVELSDSLYKYAYSNI